MKSQFEQPDTLDVLRDETFVDFLLREFRRLKAESPVRLISISLPVPASDPLAILEQLPGKQQIYFWENPKQSVSIAASGAVSTLKATGKNRFEEISSQASDLSGHVAAYSFMKYSLAGPLLLGGYSFNDHNVSPDWKNFGAARFILPEWMLVKSGHLHLLTVVIKTRDCLIDDLYQNLIEKVTQFLTLAGNDPIHIPETVDHNGIISQDQNHEYKSWEKSVIGARDLIRQGKFQKIVLARKKIVYSRHRISPTLLVHNLRSKFPSCYNFMVSEPNGATFAGATPERLVSFQNGSILTEGLAGSTSRGRSASEDASLAKNLLKSQKDRSEHSFVVQAIYDSLKSFSNSIRFPKTPHIKKLDNVQHLYTPIRAKSFNNVKIHQILKEMHPTPAVGGYPAADSIPYISKIENLDRGWYAGPIGWFNLNGSGEFAVAIRSALLEKKKAILYAGCGIVEDSDPRKEWEETLLKFKPVMAALKKSEVRDV